MGIMRTEPTQPSPPQIAQLKKQTEEVLTEWTKILYNRPEQGVVQPGSDESPATYLSQFGLRTPGALSTFLRTPAGQTVLEQLTKELIIKEEQQRDLEQERRERELMMHRIMAALFLWEMSKKAHAKKKSDELVLDQIVKAMERLHSATPKSNSFTDEKYVQGLRNSLAHYERAIKAAEAKMAELAKEKEANQADLAESEKSLIAIHLKHKAYADQLDDKHFAHLHNPDGTLDTVAVEKSLADNQAEMGKLFASAKDKVENGEDIKHIQNEIEGRYLRQVRMEEMLAAHRNEKRFVDEHGNPASHRDAAFALRADCHIVKDGDVCYLVKPGQTLDQLKQDGPQAQLEARTNFEKSKLDLMPVKRLVHVHRQLELTAHTEHRDRLLERSAQIGAEERACANQTRLLCSARATVQAQLLVVQGYTLAQQSNPAGQLQAPAPRPVVTPTATMKGGRAPQAAATVQSARLTQNTLVSEAALKMLQQLNMTPTPGKPLTALQLLMMHQRPEYSSMLKQQEREFGGGPAPDDALSQQEEQDRPSDEMRRSTAPTPFKTDPYK